MIIDDHSLFRQGLARLLESHGGFRIQAICGSVEEGLEAVRSSLVDVVLLDFDLGLQRGFEYQKRARAEGLDRPILVVTAGLTQMEAGRAMQLGASGIFVKHDSPQDLATAIRRVVEGGEWLDPRYAQAREYLNAPPEALDAGRMSFSDRERAVLRGVLEGLANKEIADELGVSEASVKATLQRLFHKTGVRTRGQLVRTTLEEFPEELD